MNRLLTVFVSAALVVGCEEKIIEYHQDGDKTFTNDLLHGDLIGRVLPLNSGAVVFVSQVALVDSATINPVDGSFTFRDLRAGNYDMTIKANNYRYHRRANLQIPGGTITYAGEITLSKVPDLVSSYYPLDGDEVVYDWRYGRISVSLYFERDMDRASVEQAFSTDPPSEGIFRWGTYTRAPYSGIYYDNSYADIAARPEYGATITTYSKVRSMTYVMAQKDQHADTTYTVTLSTAAKDTSGERLRFPLTFSFRTVQSYTTIYGIQSDPMHGDVNVNPLTSYGIRITFPRRMNPGSTEAATTITPAMNRVFLWPEENVMVIYPGGPFLTDTTIAVTIGASALDKDGVPLGKPYVLSFRTAPLSISYSSPRNGDLFVQTATTITLNFNSYVKLSTVLGAVTIFPNVPGSFAYYSYYSGSDNPSMVIFSPAGELAPNTKYTVTITTGIRDMYDVPLKQPYQFSFVTRPN